MAATLLRIYNGALRMCGERKLVATTDNVPSRHYLDDGYEGLVDECLESMEWNFAARVVRATYSPSVSPDFGYQYAFDKPSDWKRTVDISADEYFSYPLTKMRDQGGYWFCDYDTIFVRYVSDDNAYGRDFSLWPEKFTQWVSCKLALRIVERLSQNASKKADLERDEKRLFKEARGHDGASESLKFPPLGSLASARLGRS